MEELRGGCLSIALSGAELAEFKELWRLELFSCSGDGSDSESTQLVELRSKTGIGGVELTSPFFSFGRAADHGDETGLLEGVAAAASPIVLKSRAVIAATKKSMEENEKSKDSKHCSGKDKTKKKRAVSMDETSLSPFQHTKKLGDPTSKDDLFKSKRRFGPAPLAPAAPLPLPLPPLPPPPPPRGSRNQYRSHRRHLSIDLRASPAAKFLVQVMPWEISSSLDEDHEDGEGGRRSTSHCFVPFKWEEVPGKPKHSRDGDGGTPRLELDRGGAIQKLQLPPRLQQQQDRSSLQRSSPTSTLDRAAVEFALDSSSSSSPNASAIDAASSASSSSEADQGRRWIRALLALHIWEIVRMKPGRTQEDHLPPPSAEIAPRGKSKRSEVSAPYPSWSPAPTARSWFQRSPVRIQDRSSSVGRIARRSCNVVKRAVRFRWWSSCRPRSRGFYTMNKTRSSVYKPLLCRIDGDSAAFSCSSTARI